MKKQPKHGWVLKPCGSDPARVLVHGFYPSLAWALLQRAPLAMGKGRATRVTAQDIARSEGGLAGMITGMKRKISSGDDATKEAAAAQLRSLAQQDHELVARLFHPINGGDAGYAAHNS